MQELMEAWGGGQDGHGRVHRPSWLHDSHRVRGPGRVKEAVRSSLRRLERMSRELG